MPRCERSCHEKRRILRYCRFPAFSSISYVRGDRRGSGGSAPENGCFMSHTPRAVTGDGTRLTAQIYAETYLSRHFS
jgi:hypothetical protein